MGVGSHPFKACECVGRSFFRHSINGGLRTLKPTPPSHSLHAHICEGAIITIHHYLAANYRHAVLDAIVAVFDKVRERTGLDLDGDNLINQSLSLTAPLLVLSELDTDSGRNNQKKGVY